jgi:phosphoenolpyruvate phosphomutase
MMMLTEAGARRLRETYETLRTNGAAHPVHQSKNLVSAALTDILQVMIDRGVEVRALDTYKGWMEIDTFEDYRRAWAQVR